MPKDHKFIFELEVDGTEDEQEVLDYFVALNKAFQSVIALNAWGYSNTLAQWRFTLADKEEHESR